MFMGFKHNCEVLKLPLAGHLLNQVSLFQNRKT